MRRIIAGGDDYDLDDDDGNNGNNDDGNGGNSNDGNNGNLFCPGDEQAKPLSCALG